ncbi:MAG: tetratricopeptide repeat protein [Deltaproteobacteria bacterium]
MRNLKFSLILLCLFVGTSGLISSGAAAQNESGAAGYYKEGRQAFLKFTPEGFEKAISLYNQAVSADPNYAPAYAGLAEVYSFMGWYRYNVKEDYEKYYNDSYANMVKALQLGPNLKETQVALAYSYLHLSREKEAVLEARKVLAEDPNNAEALYVLWSALGENPDSPEIRKVLELNRTYIPAYIGLGTALFFKKRAYGQAAQLYKEASEIAPSAQIHNYIGTALRTQGQYNAAIAEYQKAIELNPNYAPAHMNLGITYFYLNKYNENIERQKKAISLNPNYPDTYFFMAQGYEGSNNPQQAIIYYKKFLDLSVEQGEYAGYVETAKQRLSALGGGSQ